mmetsp:Transcript_12732/g.12383  ORF Transcript_12732/g.12383 Transcript_12732/m.12383 type:complete len:163 (+) Transcript_12732:347-835(+)
MFPGDTPCEKLKYMLVKQQKDSQADPLLKLKMKHYFIATQDQELRMRVGSVPGVPIIYLNKVTLVMEPPSVESREFSKEIEASKVGLNSQEETALDKIKTMKTKLSSNVLGGTDTISENIEEKKNLERKKRKASAANPLSSMVASGDSNTSKKQKKNKFKRA